MTVEDGLHDVTVNFWSGSTHLTFRCRADKDTDPDCHMACSRSGCEEGCFWPEEHEKTNQGYCLVAEWLENQDSIECILGRDTEITVPIAYDWHPEGVDWRFASIPERPTLAH